MSDIKAIYTNHDCESRHKMFSSDFGSIDNATLSNKLRSETHAMIRSNLRNQTTQDWLQADNTPPSNQML